MPPANPSYLPVVKRLSILLPFIVATTAHAIEPWADKSLPVKDGLALWLDACAEVAAAKAGDADV